MLSCPPTRISLFPADIAELRPRTNERKPSTLRLARGPARPARRGFVPANANEGRERAASCSSRATICDGPGVRPSQDLNPGAPVFVPPTRLGCSPCDVHAGLVFPGARCRYPSPARARCRTVADRAMPATNDPPPRPDRSHQDIRALVFPNCQSSCQHLVDFERLSLSPGKPTHMARMPVQAAPVSERPVSRLVSASSRSTPNLLLAPSAPIVHIRSSSLLHSDRHQPRAPDHHSRRSDSARCRTRARAVSATFDEAWLFRESPLDEMALRLRRLPTRPRSVGNSFGPPSGTTTAPPFSFLSGDPFAGSPSSEHADASDTPAVKPRDPPSTPSQPRSRMPVYHDLLPASLQPQTPADLVRVKSPRTSASVILRCSQHTQTQHQQHHQSTMTHSGPRTPQHSCVQRHRPFLATTPTRENELLQDGSETSIRTTARLESERWTCDGSGGDEPGSGNLTQPKGVRCERTFS